MTENSDGTAIWASQICLMVSDYCEEGMEIDYWFSSESLQISSVALRAYSGCQLTSGGKFR